MLIFVLGIQIVWAVCESAAAVRYRKIHQEPTPVGKSTASFLPISIGIVAAVLAVWITVFSSQLLLDFTWKICAAITMAVVGIALRFFSIRTLGPWFRDSIDLAPSQPRIVTGPYRFLRHPAEIGFLLIMGSLVVVVPGITSIGLWVILASLCNYRMWLEEKLFRNDS